MSIYLVYSAFLFNGGWYIPVPLDYERASSSGVALKVQLEFFDVPSPCVGICQSNPKGYCIGCMRTRDERKDWINLDNDNKQKVIKRCIQRKKRQKNKSNHKDVEEIKSLEIEHEPEQPSLLDPPTKPKFDDDNDLDFGDFEL